MNITRRNDILKFLIFIGALVIIWYTGRFFHIDTAVLEGSLRKVPALYSGIVFIVLYVVVTFFVWLSSDVFRLIAALVFGVFYSSVFVWIAEIINAFILFYFARYLARGFVKDYLKAGNGWDKRLAELDFFWLFMFRLAPLIPFRFLDLGLGLTSIPFRRYLVVVICASFLRILWLQYILFGVGKQMLHNPLALSGYLLQNKALFAFSFIYLLLVAAVALKMKFKKEA